MLIGTVTVKVTATAKAKAKKVKTGYGPDAELDNMDEGVGNTTAETEDFDEMDETEAGELDE